MLAIYLTYYKMYFETLFLKYGMNSTIAHLLNVTILCSVVAVLAIIANFLAKKVIIGIIKRWVDKSPNTYDDIFYEKGVFNKLSHLAPALIIAYLSPLALTEYSGAISFISSATSIYILVAIIMVAFAIINALHEIYNNSPMGKQRTIKGYIQAVKTIIYVVGALMVVSILVKKDLSSLFAGLTAFAAVLMFVFKDTILGLIAGIQISSNDILRVGDYIEMPSRNVDGTVFDIKLNTVKVHNANKTISTIPTYSFISESFWNWRGLDTAEGRRIRRFINIDISSIKFCSDDLLLKIKKVDLMKSFFEQNDAKYNHNNVWQSSRYTNSQLFRAYIEAYLKNNPNINSSMNFMIRHLQPTEHGLPMEIYVYTFEKVGSKYEAIQSDIFDYIIAIAPEFEIKFFQDPTGKDVRNI
jgi:miniconductance mechanosensitive channel